MQARSPSLQACTFKSRAAEADQRSPRRYVLDTVIPLATIVEPVVTPAIVGQTFIIIQLVELRPFNCTTVADTVDLVAADLRTVRLVDEPNSDTV